MSFKRRVLLILFSLLCLSVQVIHAQESAEDKVTRLATKFDQYAASYGLSNGDGQISAVERAYAAALIEDVVGYSQLVAEFAAADRGNARMLVLMEAGYLNVQQDLPIADPNEPMLRQAIEDYKDSLPEEEYEKAEQALLNLNDDLLAPLTAPVIPPATADDDVLAPLTPPDTADDDGPLAPPPADSADAADDDLLAPLTPPDTADDDELLAPLTPVEVEDDLLAPLTPPESTDDDDGPLAPPPPQDQEPEDDLLAPLTPKKTINRHVKKVIRDTFKLPKKRVKVVNSIYNFRETNRTVAGDCGGSAPAVGGEGLGAYSPDSPAFQAHVCFSNEHGLISVDTEMFRWYGRGALDMYQSDAYFYGDHSSQQFLTVIDEGSFDVTTVTDYGTCTVTSNMHYELYAPGEVMGCNPNSKVWVVNGSLVNVDTGNQPTEEEKDEEVPVPPITAGQYKIHWLPLDEERCDQQYAPSFDSVTVTPTSFDSVDLIINGETYTFGGRNLNEGLTGRFEMERDTLRADLNRRFAEDFNFFWHQSSPDYQSSCAANGTLTLESPAADQPKFTLADRVEAPADVVDPMTASAPFDAPASGSYSVEATPMITSECTAERAAELPQITQATLDVAEGSITLDLGAEQYTLSENIAGYTYYKFEEDYSGVMVSISDARNGVVSASYAVYASDMTSCSVNLTLTQ